MASRFADKFGKIDKVSHLGEALLISNIEFIHIGSIAFHNVTKDEAISITSKIKQLAPQDITHECEMVVYE